MNTCTLHQCRFCDTRFPNDSVITLKSFIKDLFYQIQVEGDNFDIENYLDQFDFNRCKRLDNFENHHNQSEGQHDDVKIKVEHDDVLSEYDDADYDNDYYPDVTPETIIKEDIDLVTESENREKKKKSSDLKIKLQISGKTSDNSEVKKKKKQVLWRHCDVCQIGFPSQKQFDQHRVEKHAEKVKEQKIVLPEDVVCHVCGKSFPTELAVRQHIKRIHEGLHQKSTTKSTDWTEEVICYVCGTSMQKHALRRHIRLVHELGDQIKNYSDVQTEQHDLDLADVEEVLDHEGKPQLILKRRYQCRICDKSFVRNHGLTKHMNAAHASPEERPKFYCDVCGKGYTQRHCVERHKLRMTDEKHVKNVQETNPQLLLKQKDEKCTQCSKTFARRDTLLMHIKEVHTDEMTKFHCKICNLHFKRVYNYKTHLHTARHKQLTANAKKVKQLEHVPKDNQKPYVCIVCQKGFIYYNCYRDHNKICNGGTQSRSLLCGVCLIPKMGPSKLHVHMKTHHGFSTFYESGCISCVKGLDCQRNLSAPTGNEPEDGGSERIVEKEIKMESNENDEDEDEEFQEENAYEDNVDQEENTADYYNNAQNANDNNIQESQEYVNDNYDHGEVSMKQEHDQMMDVSV